MPTAKDLEIDARFACPARMSDPTARKDPIDYWRNLGPDRVCSFCNCLHFDEFISWCERGAEKDSHVRVETTDRAGKWRLVRRGINSPSQGATVFYHFHMPKEGSTEAERIRWNTTVGNIIEISVSRMPAKPVKS